MRVYKVIYEYSYGNDVFDCETCRRFIVARDLDEAERKAYTGVRPRLRENAAELWSVEVREIPFKVVELECA